MRKAVFALSMSMLVVGVGVAGSALADQTNTTTVTSTPVTVAATADFYPVRGATAPVDTGIVVQPGQTVTIAGVAGSGTIDACGGLCPVTAPAIPGYFGAGVNGTFGYLGAGNTYTNTTGSAGTLQLGILDTFIATDNSGSIAVTVNYTVACTPGRGLGDANHVHCGAPGQLK